MPCKKLTPGLILYPDNPSFFGVKYLNGCSKTSGVLHSKPCLYYIFLKSRRMWMCKFPVGILLFVCNLALVAQAKDSLVPEDPADRVGPGIVDFFKRDRTPPVYQVTRNHMHIGFRWQPYADQPKNSEADIERELGRVGSYASFWYMSLHTIPERKNLDYENIKNKEKKCSK